MSGLDGLSSSSDSGADRGDRRGDREEDRPFPGAPLDRPPAPPVPEGTLSWDEIMADPATYEAALREMHAGRDSYSGTLDALDPSGDPSDSCGDGDASDRDTADPADEAREPGDNRADTSGDDAEALRQEIASLKADNAQQKAEIENLKSEVSGLKSEIAEIREALRDPQRTSESCHGSGMEGQKPGEPEEHKPGDKGVITHFHGKDLDLYTDGTRWVSGDAVKAMEARNVVGEKDNRSPGDISDLPPTGEELVKTEESDLPRPQRLGRKLFREVDDVVDAAKTETDAVSMALKNPGPTNMCIEGSPPTRAPEITDASPHPTPTPGAIVEATLYTGLALFRTGQAIEHRLRRERRSDDGGN